MTRPEFVHMADAYRRIAASYDMLGQPYIGAEYRYRADLLVLPDLCGACGMDPTGTTPQLIHVPTSVPHNPFGNEDCWCVADGREQPVAPDDAVEVDTPPTDPDHCTKSYLPSGEHPWRFDGDDPYVICDSCGEIRDALTGRVVRPPQTGDGAAVSRVAAASADEGQGSSGGESDSSPLLLDPGGYEVPEEIVQRYGSDLLDEINRTDAPLTPAQQIRKNERDRKGLDST